MKGKNIIIDVLSLSLYNCVLVENGSIAASNRIFKYNKNCCADVSSLVYHPLCRVPKLL